MKLTEKTIAALDCEAGRRDRLVFDDDVSALAVRVTAAGSKTFLAQYSMGREKRRVPLGKWGAVTLAEARKAARTIMGEVAAGKDPAGERKAQRQQAQAKAEADRYTLAALLDDWSALALHDKSPRYQAEAVRAVRVAFGKHLDRPAAGLTRTTALKILDGMVKAGTPALATRTLAYGRACYGWAVKRGKLTDNPFAGLPAPATVPSRDRALTAVEVGAVFAAAETMPFPFGPLFRVLLLTAQRREEVAGMRWSELSPDLTTWTLPGTRTKNGQEHVVHLSEPARAVLSGLPRVQGQDLVFSTTGKTAPSGFSAAMTRLRKATEAERARRADAAGEPAPRPMAEWRLHDFRRSCVTWLADHGFNPVVADKILNHVAATGLSDVARVYQKSAFLTERKAALDAWGAHVQAMAEGRTADPDVIDLNAHRAGEAG
ncbi:site-specific integrase [uncultured Rhodospira sp.]|uniref:tyrosine-type recombinase/integrase n=1 Tax=uncultured Rhodospira sp. TaxID=1936189 RepID=UPI002612A198|nr:site-specific integrase [uncultured Rhodospira sp.]